MGNKLFGTDGVRGVANVYPMTADFAMKLALACAETVCKNKKRVAIGKDTRISGDMLEAALSAGFTAKGIDVIRLGVLPTPAVTTVTPMLDVDMSVMITASHNPYKDNGIKLIAADGEKFADTVTAELEAKIEANNFSYDEDALGKIKDDHKAIDEYVKIAKSTMKAGTNLKGLKIVLDCANGATYHVAPLVFKELGAKVITIGTEPNGVNINDGVGSTHPEALIAKVLSSHADLGIAFDGDGDRVMMVDNKGQLLDGDAVLYIIACDRQRRGKLGGGVVGTLMSNLGLELALKEKNIDFVRSKVGDRYVMETLLEKGWRLGGENSGHVICLDYVSTGDGIVSALQVLKAALHQQKSLAQLVSDLKMLPQELINLRLRQGFDALSDDVVKQEVKAVEDILGAHGRVLLRKSGTEPVVRVMVEGEVRSEVHDLAVRLADTIRRQAEEG